MTQKLVSDERRAVVIAALQPGANKSQIARRYGISRARVYQLMEIAMTDPKSKLREAEREVGFRRRVLELSRRGSLASTSRHFSRFLVEGWLISHLAAYLCSVCYNCSSCSEFGNSAASIATPSETRQFSALAPVGTASRDTCTFRAGCDEALPACKEALRKAPSSLWWIPGAWETVCSE